MNAKLTELADAIEREGAGIYSDVQSFSAHGDTASVTVYHSDGLWLVLVGEDTVRIPDTLPVPTVAEIIAVILRDAAPLPPVSPEGVAEMTALLTAEVTVLETPADTILVTVDDETYYPARLLARSGMGDANGTTLIAADAERWNGFVNPLFTREVMERICADWSGEFSDGDIYTMGEDGTFTLDCSAHYADDPDGGISTDKPREADGLYGTFTFGYTWYVPAEDPDA